MATRKYRKFVHALVTGGANVPNLGSAELKWALIDSGEVQADTTITGHEYLSDIAAGVLTTTPALSNVTVTDALVDADDVTLPDPGGGATGEYLVLYADTGNPATSRLILCSDDATNLPITLDGTDDEIQHNVQGITQFG